MQHDETPADATRPQRSRRRLLAGLGAGLGAMTVGVGRSTGDRHDVTVTMDNNGFTAWQVINTDGDGASAPLDQDNPTIEFKPGVRYKVENNGWSSHPLAFRDTEANPLLSQRQYADGSFEDDPGVNWIDSGEQLAFTLTNELATELDEYICTVHSQMLGSATIDASSGDPAALASFITAAHETVGVNRATNEILLNEVRLDDGGFLAIHDGRLENGQPVESVVGVSRYLQSGDHETVFIPLT